MIIQEHIDTQLLASLTQARKQNTPVNQLLASLRDHTPFSAQYWLFVERMYQLALKQGVFLNSESFLKLRRQETRLVQEGVTLFSEEELPADKEFVGVGKAVSLYPSTIVLVLKALQLNKSLRALAYELFMQDEEGSDPTFIKESEQAGLTDFEEVFRQELADTWGTDDYITFS